jgi:hypothetical protein
MHTSGVRAKGLSVMQLGCISTAAAGGEQSKGDRHSTGNRHDADDVHRGPPRRPDRLDMHQLQGDRGTSARYPADPGPMGYSGALSAR